MQYDSANTPIKVGDKVKWRGKEYTIKEFKPGQGRSDTSAIEFYEEHHLSEIPDELSVDLIAG